MAYDNDDTPNPDLAALETREADLRLFVEEMTEIVMALPMPETFAEADRSVRAVTAADRFLQRVPPSPAYEVKGGPVEPGKERGSPVRDPHRLKLRTHGDKLMATARGIDKPTCFLEGERALRYALSTHRMLTQLYTPPKATRPSRDAWSDSDADPWSQEAAYTGPYADPLEARLADRLCAEARKAAIAAGYWPDGSTYNPEDPDYWKNTPSDVIDATAAANRAAGKPVPMPEDHDAVFARLTELLDDMISGKSIPT
ncbi:MAG: hypothetical protein WDN06_02635 [Asticcacaulis sp.]